MMGLEQLRHEKDILDQIDWELTPFEAVEMFDHRTGGLKSRLRLRSPKGKYYFFCVDNWQEEPRVVLKERSLKESRTIAEISAPKGLLRECVRQYGGRQGLFPLCEPLRLWLMECLYAGNL